MALWGSGLVVARAAHGFVPPMALTFWRWVVAALVLLPFVRRGLPAALPLVRLHWRVIGALTLSMACGAAFSVAAVNNLMPVFGVGLATLFLGEGLAGYHVAGAAFVFTGILLSIRQAQAAAGKSPGSR